MSLGEKETGSCHPSSLRSCPVPRRCSSPSLLCHFGDYWTKQEVLVLWNAVIDAQIPKLSSGSELHRACSLKLLRECGFLYMDIIATFVQQLLGIHVWGPPTCKWCAFILLSLCLPLGPLPVAILFKEIWGRKKRNTQLLFLACRPSKFSHPFPARSLGASIAALQMEAAFIFWPWETLRSTLLLGPCWLCKGHVSLQRNRKPFFAYWPINLREPNMAPENVTEGTSQLCTKHSRI